MRLSLYDKDLNRISIIGEHFVSCLWSEGYNTVEPFTLELQAVDEYKRKVRPDFYIGRDDRKTLMVIKTAEVKGNKIVASGKQATRVLDDCVYVGTVSEGVNLDTGLKNAYNNTVGYPLLSHRPSGLSVKTKNQASNKSMLEMASALCQAADVGFRVVRDGKTLFFETYQPEENPNLIFSADYGNLTVNSVTLSTENLKNYAIVLGEGEGASRVRVDVDKTDGGDRLEMVIDARDLQKEEGETDAHYLARLKERGISELLAKTRTWNCAFTPLSVDFGKTYDLGDIAKIYLRDYGITLKARIAKFSQKAQGNKTTTNISVGEITILR